MAFDMSVRQQPRRPKRDGSKGSSSLAWRYFRPRLALVLGLATLLALYGWGVPSLRWNYVMRGTAYVACEYLFINGDGVRMTDGHCPVIRAFKILPYPWELI